MTPHRLLWGIFLLLGGMGLALAAIPGGQEPVPVDDPAVVAAAEFAVSARQEWLRQQEGKEAAEVKLVKVLNARQQVVAGINYHLRMEVMVGKHPRLVDVVVWWQAWRQPDPYRMTSWVPCDPEA